MNWLVRKWRQWFGYYQIDEFTYTHAELETALKPYTLERVAQAKRSCFVCAGMICIDFSSFDRRRASPFDGTRARPAVADGSSSGAASPRDGQVHLPVSTFSATPQRPACRRPIIGNQGVAREATRDG
jgi:hypothetical protein